MSGLSGASRSRSSKISSHRLIGFSSFQATTGALLTPDQAVIPGAGSAYVGRWSEAALAFFLTGVFIYATVTSFERDQVAAGTVFGALALAFYGGSIWAAVGGAHKFNDRHRTEYLAQQRTKFGIVVRGRGVGAAFERNF